MTQYPHLLCKGTYKFYNRAREQSDSIADFVAFLREIAKYCDYEDTLNMMLRDQLVRMWC